MGYKDIGMDHFAVGSDSLYRAVKKGTLHRNFMGYTASKTQLMIGLGASSIGDSWYGFAQNVKNIEEYQHLLAHDIIPIYRGHLMNNEDELVRGHILDLMCHFETRLNAEPTSQLDSQCILENLSELEADGLVHIHSNGIKVTEKGRPFIRNIGMAFDLRLHRKKPETKMFSMTV